MSTTDETGSGTPSDAGADAESASQPSAPLSALPMRLVEAFFSPGKLVAALAERPVWAGALLLGMVLMFAQNALIPTEVWLTMIREQMIARGQDPNMMKGGVGFIRAIGMVGPLVAYPLMLMVMSGLTTLTFVFVLGDEGRFKQYLAVMAHAMLIGLVVGLALVPLRIAQSDPRLTLNLGTFLFFLKEGYVYRWAKLFDLTSLWVWLVVAQGAVAIDRRRSFGSAATVVMVIFLLFVSLLALLPGSA